MEEMATPELTNHYIKLAQITKYNEFEVVPLSGHASLKVGDYVETSLDNRTVSNVMRRGIVIYKSMSSPSGSECHYKFTTQCGMRGWNFYVNKENIRAVRYLRKEWD